jgi:hypothetical protein
MNHSLAEKCAVVVVTHTHKYCLQKVANFFDIMFRLAREFD